jgi:hypothetical protein
MRIDQINYEKVLLQHIRAVFRWGKKGRARMNATPIIVKTIALRASYNLAPTPSFKGGTVLEHGGLIYCTSSIHRDIPGQLLPCGAETMLPRMQVPGVQILHGSLVKKSKKFPGKMVST